MTSSIQKTSTINDKMDLLKQYGYSPESNELDNYDNVTYHIKLSMLSNTLTNNKIIIAESGATEMNISSFQMQQTVSPNQLTRNIGTNTMTMVIYDPFSSDIYDKLRIAATELYIPDATKSMFLIELSFMGYDPVTGKQNTNIYGTSRIKCIMLDIDTQINVDGSMHTISLVEGVDQGSMDENMIVDRSLIIQSSSGTLGDVLNNFAIKLSQANKDSHYGIPMTTYKFDFEDYSKEDIQDGISSPKDLIVKINSSNSGQPQRNPDDISAPRSVSIQNIIEQLLSNSPTATKLLGNIDPNTRQVNDKFIKGIGHKILTSVQYGPWMEIFRSYEKIITYKIVPFKVFHILNSPNNIKNFVDTSDMSIEKFKAICKTNGLKKEYNYQYTGKNTEVLNFDIKTKTNFSYIFLPAMGTSTYSQATSTPKYQKDNQVLKDLVRQQDALKQKLTANSEAIKNETDPEKKKNLVTISNTTSSQIDALNTQIASAASTVQSNAEEQQTIRDNFLSKKSSIQYIDDIENSIKTKEYDSLVPASLLTNNVDTVGFSGIIEEHKDFGQSIYSALLSQYYGSGTDALQTVNIDIRVDPYWITKRNANEVMSDNKVISITEIDYGTQEYFKSEFAHFILNFNIPDGFNTTSDNIKINLSDMYSGVYQVITVTSHFENGSMHQTLEAVKLNVLTLGRIMNGSSNTSIGGNSNTVATGTIKPSTSQNNNIVNAAKAATNNIKSYIDNSSSNINQKQILSNIISTVKNK